MIVANPEDPATYPNLGLLIDAFEETALRSETRAGAMAVMHGPLDGMDALLEGSQATLQKVQGTRRQTSHEATSRYFPNASVEDGEVQTSDINVDLNLDGNPGVSGEFESLSINVEKRQESGPLKPPPAVTASGGLHLDSDLASLFGADGEQAEDIQAYMRECFGCDLRLSFDWELGPFDLLGPIADFLNEINAALDRLEQLTNPINLFNNFCASLNNFNIFCPPDLIAMLMALKMLLKKYLLFSLEVRLDWTVVLGPLLQLIVEALATLIEQLAGIIMAPLDCAIAVLETFEQLEAEIRDTVETVKGVGTGLKTRGSELLSGGIFPGVVDFQVNNRDLLRDPETGRFSSRSRSRDEAQDENSWGTVISGFDFESRRDLRGLIQTDEINWTSTLRAAVQEARDYVDDLVRKILLTLRSLKGLVGGGLTVQLESLGFMTLLLQLIRMVMLLIKLMKMEIKPADWCSFVEEHPEILQDALQRWVDPAARVERTATGMNLTLHNQSGEIATCVSDRPSVDTATLQSWISDLTRGPA